MARTAKPFEELTEQQKINRIRNEKAKKKRELKRRGNVTPINSEVKTIVHDFEHNHTPSCVDSTSQSTESYIDDHIYESDPSLKKKFKTSRSGWQNILEIYKEPSAAFYSFSVISISSYLAYQFHLYSDILTGLMVEFLAIVFAFMYAINDKFVSKIFSFVCLLSVIIFSSISLHEGMSNTISKSDENLNNIRGQRDVISGQITMLQDQYNKLPLTHKTAKKEINDEIKSYSSQLSNIDLKISKFKLEVKSDYSSIIIRVLCMLANMLLIHMFINFIRIKNGTLSP